MRFAPEWNEVIKDKETAQKGEWEQRDRLDYV